MRDGPRGSSALAQSWVRAVASPLDDHRLAEKCDAGCDELRGVDLRGAAGVKDALALGQICCLQIHGEEFVANSYLANLTELWP